jgi:hypothetical protein
MSLSSIRKRTHEAAPQEPEGPQRCEALGCPCLASVQIEGGRWLCSTHGFAVPEVWPRVTEKLREHEWLIQFTTDIQKMDRRNEEWREFAERFWDGQDDFCKPVAGEMVNGRRTRCEFAIPYFNRMKRELDYRVGLCQRPQPRIPEDIGNLFIDLAKKERRRTA